MNSIPLESIDRLFDVKPVRKAHKIVSQELKIQDEEFRQDAEGADLTVAKTHLSADKVEDVKF